jgi:hypothetical protein
LAFCGQSNIVARGLSALAHPLQRFGPLPRPFQGFDHDRASYPGLAAPGGLDYRTTPLRAETIRGKDSRSSLLLRGRHHLGYNAGMKYSLRSLMIVVTLATFASVILVV